MLANVGYGVLGCWFRSLVSRDIIVVSDLAAGIDTAVHQAAIEFGGRTIAVLGTPLDQCYPAFNAEPQGTN